VALVERDDFASGTSSKSSKMIHGGLRYLQQGDVKLVRQALHERQRLFDNAPHLVTVLPFMIPILSKDGVVSKKVARALGSAMWMYDVTGGWRIGKLHRRLRKAKAFAHLPTMHEERLASAYLYFDAGADDARVVLTLCRTAAANGAVVANRCGVTSLTHGADGKVNGAVVHADGRDIRVRAAAVVNAAGVWSDDVRALDEGTHPDTIRPAKGVHVTVPWHKVRCDIAVVIPVPKDRRSLFLVPWGPKADGTFEHAYIGTTDTDYSGSLDDPQCTKADIDYVLRAVNASLTTDVTEADITGVWAGLRPLVKAADDGRTADLSRNHALHVSDNGVFTITGGKLTTYREMAEDTVDAVAQQLGRTAKCRTRKLPLLGAGRRQRPDGSAESHLYGRYGTLAEEIRALVATDPSLGLPLAPGQPHLRAEAVYAARHEMALTVDDVLTRRTRIRLFDRRAAMEAAHVVAELLAAELDWSAEETDRQVQDFLALCAAEQTAGASA
jgi:glycerol-3-phosphate dehydrogenase